MLGADLGTEAVHHRSGAFRQEGTFGAGQPRHGCGAIVGTESGPSPAPEGGGFFHKGPGGGRPPPPAAEASFADISVGSALRTSTNHLRLGDGAHLPRRG